MGRAFIRDCNGSGAFLKLTRYEARIERTLYRNMEALQRLQAIQEQAADRTQQVKLQNDLTDELTVAVSAA